MRRSSVLILLALSLLPVRAGAQVPVTLDAVTNDSCANPVVLEGGRVYEGNNTLATDRFSSSGGRGAGSPDLVYRFTLTEPQLVTLRLLEPSNRTHSTYSMFYIRRVCDDRTSQEHDDAIGRSVFNPMRLNLPAGTYHVIFDGEGLPPLDRGAFRFQYSVGPVRGNTCADPWPLDEINPAYDNTYYYSHDFNSKSGPSSGRDVVFSFTVTQQKTVILDSKGSQYDTTMYLRTVCDDIDSEIAWGDIVPWDDGYGNKRFQAKIRKTLQPGTYYVVLDGYAYHEFGQFLLTMSEE